jgi:hypothetical protein
MLCSFAEGTLGHINLAPDAISIFICHLTWLNHLYIRPALSLCFLLLRAYSIDSLVICHGQVEGLKLGVKNDM